MNGPFICYVFQNNARFIAYCTCAGLDLCKRTTVACICINFYLGSQLITALRFLCPFVPPL